MFVRKITHKSMCQELSAHFNVKVIGNHSHVHMQYM
jgi:hypothetical protein